MMHAKFFVRLGLSIVGLLGAIPACGGEASLPEGRGSSSSGEGGGRPSRPKPEPIPSPHQPGDCRIEQPAFCERFETPHPGGEAGDLDERVWAYSRHGFGRVWMESFEPGVTEWSNPDGPPVLCGETFSGILPPDDARVCQGQFNDVLGYSSDGGLPINSFMARQPFDFTDRVGTLVFDVDAKRNDGWDGHGWWLEVWITEDPAPIPYHDAPTVAPFPRNGIGIQIAPANDAFDTDPQVEQLNSVGGIAATRDHQHIVEKLFGAADGAAFRVRDQHLNRFRVELSRTSIAVYTSDWDTPDDLKLGVRLDGFELGFTVGYVHFQHVHYSPSKVPNCGCDVEDIKACAPGCECEGRCGKYPQSFHASGTQVYRWDNIGFDGPTYPLSRGYDVPDKLAYNDKNDDGTPIKIATLGYLFPGRGKVKAPDVDLTDAAYATFNFNALQPGHLPLRYRFNGNAWHDLVNPYDGDFTLKTFSVDAPLGELVDGTNTIELETEEPLGNLDLTVHPQ
jgi:hypothetical protein